MAGDVFPAVRSVAPDANTINITLPESKDAFYPRIPEALHGKELPGFVVEWLVEADEIGVIIQELLQAPTRSLCRIMPIGATAVTRQVTVQQPFMKLSTPVLQTTNIGEVRAFDAGAATIEGLPEGIRLPSRLLEIAEMGRRVEAWVLKGRRVREWLDEQGLGDLDWLPDAPKD